MKKFKDMNELKRLWYVLFCKHPFDKSTKVSAIEIYKKNSPSNNNWKFIYVVNIRYCPLCDKHFVDEGWEFKDRTLKGKN